MKAMRRTATVLCGLLALAVLLVLVVGVPLVLVAAIGNPIPADWAIAQPLSNQALLGLVACVAWVFWAQLVVCVSVETIAEIRLATGRSAEWLSRVPGTFGGQQALARTLIRAVVAIGVSGTVVGSDGPWIAHADAAEPVVTVAAPLATSTSSPSASPASAPSAAPQSKRMTATKVIVARGDTLWSIAEGHLGAGERWREIAALNFGRPMPDGSTFDEARTIEPGWILLVPGSASASAAQDVVTIERGDTLWEIAEEQYGDGADWPRLYYANRTQIEDPHWIYPGQQLLVPGSNNRAEIKPKQEASKPAPASPVTPETPPATVAPIPTPTPSSTSTQEPAPPSTGTEAVAHDDGDKASDDAGIHVDAATIARALVGGGGFLAVGLLTLYVGRRRTQGRNRRSGMAPPRVATGLRAEDKALRRAGSSSGERATFFDLVLRELAGLAEARDVELPDVVAARIDDDQLELRLRRPAHAPAPWTTSDDETTWTLPTIHSPQEFDRFNPYPALVTIGDDRAHGTWFVDLEAAGVVQILGEPSVAQDVLRFIAAELAVNSWAAIELTEVAGAAEPLVPINQGRLVAASPGIIERLAKAARQMVENIETADRDVLSTRVTDWSNAWLPTLGVTSTGEEDIEAVIAQTGELLDQMEQTPGRTSVGLVVATPALLDQRAVTLTARSPDELETPWGVLRPHRLSEEEAAAIVDIFEDVDVEADEPVPPAVNANSEPTGRDQAGALTKELTEERRGSGDPTSVLPRPDAAYIKAAATTTEDLAALAPPVPRSPRVEELINDPTLDQDLAEWADPHSRRPKLRVLGPVDLQAAGEQTKEVAGRPAYFTELVANLACHPEGVTPGQLAADFGIQPNTLHTRINQLRRWLSTKPETGEPYLPNAQWVRGKQAYRLDGILSDADLFRRLRARGSARGPGAMEDLRRAVELVRGEPYDQRRKNGYDWLVDTPDDQNLVIGIVDVAHLYATDALTDGRPKDAMWAAERAIAAAPHEVKPRLDMAKALKTLGRVDEADAYLASQVLGRTEDDRAPLDPAARTMEIVDRMDHGRSGSSSEEKP